MGVGGWLVNATEQLVSLEPALAEDLFTEMKEHLLTRCSLRFCCQGAPVSSSCRWNKPLQLNVRATQERATRTQVLTGETSGFNRQKRTKEILPCFCSIRCVLERRVERKCQSVGGMERSGEGDLFPHAAPSLVSLNCYPKTIKQ